MHLRLLLMALFAVCVSVSAVSAREKKICRYQKIPFTCVVVQNAAQQAMGIMVHARKDRNRHFVDTSRQLVAEGDRICMLTFLQKNISIQKLYVDDLFCYKRKGALALRQQGKVSQVDVKKTIRYMQILLDNPNSWNLFERHILGNVRYFSALQHIIRTSSKGRMLALKIMLRKDVVFINQIHEDGMFFK